MKIGSKENQESLENIEVNRAESGDWGDIESLLSKFGGDKKEASFNQFIVAKNGSKIIGCIRIKKLSDSSLELASLVVLPEFRRSGIGSKLVHEILKFELRRPVYLLCSGDNEIFYQKNGFKMIEPDDLSGAMKLEYEHIINLPFAKDLKVIAMRTL